MGNIASVWENQRDFQILYQPKDRRGTRDIFVAGDPVRMFEYMPQPQNSVLKLFHNLYSNPATSDLLYTNDAKVLIDVIVGRLLNLSPGDAVSFGKSFQRM